LTPPQLRGEILHSGTTHCSNHRWGWRLLGASGKCFLPLERLRKRRSPLKKKKKEEEEKQREKTNKPTKTMSQKL
ncbi:hypothetical protein Q6249_27825, partial [Klebsiella pneumoniae]|uniref:hypothetical protein n=1 Tax=Klebsiella pneumoniae TaxID=573 RepID=UPI002731BA2E